MHKKILTTVAAGTVINKNLFGGEGSDNKDEDKKEDKKEKKQKTKIKKN